jgi:fructoselysine-6-P-deglycase FrlB-like protein
MEGEAFRAVKEELKKEPEVLQRFARSDLPRAPKGSIFVGAGDSYAAAMAGFYASAGRCIALDPYSLASAPELAEGVEVFLISISGRTSSNLAAARKVSGLAKKTTTITADGRSQLAELTDEAVVLPMTYVPRTPGMLSFTLSLLAVVGLVVGMGRYDFRSVFEKAESNKGRIGWGKGTTYFLANSLGYTAAMYAAAKTYEFTGGRAQPELLEEFSHLELFTLGRSDLVNSFSCFDPSGMSRKLSRVLGEQGYGARVVPNAGNSGVERLFHAIFVCQLAIVEEAQVTGLSRPRFISREGRLHTSDYMIY